MTLTLRFAVRAPLDRTCRLCTLSYEVVQIEEADEEAHTVRIVARTTDGGGATSVLMETEILDRGILGRMGRKSVIQMAAQGRSERFAGCRERQLNSAPS